MAVLEELERLSDERFLEMYTALSRNGFGPLDGEVAKALKFRPRAIVKLPMEKRARKARGLIASRRNAELCYELFGSYLVRTRKELVGAFLDGTGVEHQEGMIENTSGNAPDESRLAATVEDLDRRFDPKDVTLYLAVAAEQWPESEALTRLWRSRAS